MKVQNIEVPLKTFIKVSLTTTFLYHYYRYLKWRYWPGLGYFYAEAVFKAWVLYLIKVKGYSRDSTCEDCSYPVSKVPGHYFHCFSCNKHSPRANVKTYGDGVWEEYSEICPKCGNG